MIQFEKCERFNDVPFQEYLSWDGYSNSFLKGEIGGVAPTIEKTPKISFGSLVDDILTNPVEADVADQRFPIARKAATKIIEYFGEGLYEMIGKQISTKAIMTDGNLSMPVKGRIDFLSSCVNDLKVTEVAEKGLDGLIQYMKYDKQIYYYSKQAGVQYDFGYIMFYLVKENRLVFKKVTFNLEMEEYFYSKLLKFGE